jgi:NodT family efflux transporter outer membrane factor (OMF) lipoprotein
MRVRVFLMGTLALALGGCEFAPRFTVPSVPASGSFKNAAAEGAPLPTDEAWWVAFHDATLDNLQAEVESANPDLAAAIAADTAAQSHAQAALASLLPHADAVGHVTANKQSDNRPLRSTDQPTYYGDNLIGAEASYEVDIWGRARDVAQSANASAEASADALAQARLELHADLARDYVELRGLDAEAKLISNVIGIYRSALDLTKSRLSAKIASPVDVDRAQTQLSNAEAQGSDLALRRAALESAIAALVGKSAASFSVARSATLPPLPKRPRAAPADVLRRRPDVAEAERLTAAANYGVGAARANFFPRVELIALGGTQDTDFRLFNPGNTLATIGPSIDLPLFDAGLRKAELEVAKAQYTEAAENYRATVLRALKEVQEDISALHWLAIERQQTATAATAARQAADLSLTLYRDGASSFLDVVTAESAALDAERLTIALRARELGAEIGLMLALGGGWSEPAEAAPRLIDLTPAPVEMANELNHARP